jgi:WD40 repeat protein/HEAT repeat protein
MNADDREHRVDEAIAEYLAACDAGTPPERDEFLARHADIAESLKDFLADHDRMRQPAPLPAPRPAEETATLQPGAAVTAEPLGRIRYFGDYELLEEIARGGMGVVFRAKQVSLNRGVAVKMILAGGYAGDRDVLRFKAEAKAAANLDHPHILPIYEVGEHSGHHYFSMKLVEGGAFLQDGRLSLRERVAVLTKVCRAVHFAHQHGILHRDLKPGNILLDADGTPYVTDFGLAKKVEGESGLTQSGAILGTPSYMPPEQARSQRQLTTAADVYALGAIVYECLTGRPPFRAATAVDTVLEVIEREPAHPRTIDPAADRDLSVVALKCLEKDPTRRYASAAALADDLERWLKGEPILARPASVGEKAWKWAKRRPAAAALVATCVLAVLAGVVGLAISNRMIADRQRQTDDALRARTAALEDADRHLKKEQAARQETAETLARLKKEQGRTAAALAAQQRAAYLSDIALAANEWAGNRPIRSAQLLDSCPIDLRGWEWHHLQRAAHAAERELDDLHGVTLLWGLSPDGKRLLSTDSEAVRIRDFATGKVVRAFSDHAYSVSAAVFTAGGKQVLSSATEAFSVGGNKKGEAVLWDAETGRVLRTFAEDHKGVSSVACSGDGKWFATAGGDLDIRLWDADSGKEVHRWKRPAVKESGFTQAARLAFSPDSKYLAVADHLGTTLWDLGTRAEVRTFKDEFGPTFSRDATKLATARGAAEFVVRDTTNWAEQFAQRTTAPMLNMLAFGPDGKRLALGGLDGLVRVWDLEQKAEVQVIQGQQGWVLGLVYSPDGKRLVTSVGDPIVELFGSWMGQTATPEMVRVWNLERGQEYRLLPAIPKLYALHPSRPEVACLIDREVHIYDLLTGTKLRSFAAAPEDVTALAYSPDGATLAVAWSVPPKKGKEFSPGAHQVHPVKNAHRVQLLDAATGKPRGEPHGQETSIGDIAFSPDGKVLALTGWGKPLTLLDGTTLSLLASLEGAEGGVTRVAFSLDGKTLVRATTGRLHWIQDAPEERTDGVIEVWDVAGRKQLRTVSAGTGFCNAIAVSPDGILIAAAMGDVVKVLRLDGSEAKTLPTASHSLVFSPDGARLVTATPVGVKLWDPLSGRDILTLGGKWSRGTNTSRVAFAAPGGFLVINEPDGLRIYDGRPWTPPPVVAKKPEPEPKKEPPADTRPEPVKTAVAKSVAALEANDPAAALLHAVAALEADPDPARQAIHRLRIALALQATPKLRPVVPTGSAELTAFAADRVTDPDATANVCDPVPKQSHPGFARSEDLKRFMTWPLVVYGNEVEEGKKTGRSPWLVWTFDRLTRQPVGPPVDLREWPQGRRLAVSLDGKRVAGLFHVKGSDKEADANRIVVRMWDTDTGKQVGADLTAKENWEGEASLRFAGAGRLLVADIKEGWRDTRQLAWDLETGKPLALAEPVLGVFGQPSDPFVVVAFGGKQAKAQVHDVRTLRPEGKPFRVEKLRDAAVSADGLRVVLANSYWLGAWDTRTGERLHAALVVRGGATALAMTADGGRYAAGFQEKDGSWVARVWDAATGDAVSPLLKLPSKCHHLHFTAADGVLVTVTATETRAWDARTGEPVIPALKCDGATSSPFDNLDDMKRADAVILGDLLFVRRSVETSQYDRWQLTPDPRPAAQLRELAEAIAGRRLDAAGTLQPIPAEELFTLRKQLMGRFPAAFGTPVPTPDAVLSSRPDPRVQQVIGRLRDRKLPANRRSEAASGLATLNDPAGRVPLMEALASDPDAGVRSAAAGSLGAFLSPEVVQALIRALKEDTHDHVRATAARAIHGPAVKTATAALLAALEGDKSAAVREGAATALRGATPSPAILVALRAAMQDSRSLELRLEAAMSVAVLSSDDPDAVNVLAAVLVDNEGWWGVIAAKYLSELGPRAAPAVPALVKVLETDKQKYQPHFLNRIWHTLHALARIGPAAKPAAAIVLAHLGQDQANPHWFNTKTNYLPPSDNIHAYILARIGPDTAPDLLKVFREDKDAQRRRAAVIALGFLGPPAKASLDVLEAEARKLEAKEEKTQDEEWLALALEKAIRRIRDPKAIPVDKLE